MEFYLAHVGINPENADELENMLMLIRLLFPEERISENALSYFGAKGKIELMKEAGYGTKGHLAFYASDIHEAINMMGKNGFRFDYSTAKYDEDGSLRLIYIDREINGFAIHLTTRK